MKIVFDHCVPKPFKRNLTDHFVRTAFEMGWSNLDNGVLLGEAAKHFDVLLTIDQNMRYQHNLATLPISVVILVAEDNEPDTLKPFTPHVLELLRALPARTMATIHLDGKVELHPASK